MLNPDFAPFLQRVRDAAPDGVYVFIPAGQAATMMRQFVERGLDKSGIRLFGAGDITDDDLLNSMGDVALGIETAYFYSAAHPSDKNKAFVEGMKRANSGMRANFFGVSGYDGMHLISDPYFFAALTGSLTFSTVANSIFQSSPFTLSTLRM